MDKIEEDTERFAEFKRLDRTGDLFRDNEHERQRIQNELEYFESEYGWTLPILVATGMGKFTKEQMKLPYPWCAFPEKCSISGRCEKEINCGE